MSSTFTESQNLTRFLNPWALHFQKLGLELKCPLCLHLLKKPTLLPCDHIFCNDCVPNSTHSRSACPSCKHLFDDKDTRPAPYIENMVVIYKTMDAILQPLSTDVGNGIISKQITVDNSRKDIIIPNSEEKAEKAANTSMLLIGAPKEEIETGSNSEIGTFQQIENTNVLHTSEIDTNQVPQLSPATSNSFNYINGNTHMKECVEKSKMRKRVEKESESVRIGINNDPNRDFKRQKIVITKNCALTVQQESSSEDATIRSLCSFCHSSKISEGSGPMLYYAQGKEVFGDITKLSNVIPVHKKCVEWTPQVYFEGENIKNLESELARADKLKCTSCGIKGAGLGCYAKSCKNTYHVPCAYDILECRWDCENFLVLCPKHNNVKFPNESSKRAKFPRQKSKPGKCSSSSSKLDVSDPVLSKQLSFWESLPNGPKEWVFCGSALSSEDKYILVKFASMCGATVTKYWKPNVTHVIAATNEDGACVRTLKVLMSILNGKWILTMDWVKACMEAKCPKNEEPYEIELDNHGCYNGPKTGRLRVSTQEPKLFDGLRFYFSGDFVGAYKNDLLDLVECGGGVIIENKRQASSSKCIIVYNSDVTQEGSFKEEGDIVSQRLAEAQDLGKEANSQVVRHTWILESIAGCKLRPFVC